MEGASLGNNKTTQFLHLISSWSLDHILINQLYNFQVEEIPKTFDSVQHHLNSFVNPLLEETRCELAYNMEIIHKSPFAQISSYSKAKGNNKEMLYDVTISTWRNRFNDRGQEPYRTIPDDLLILANERPKSISDLKKLVGRTWGFALVHRPENVNNTTSVSFKVEASKHIEFQQGMFVVFLMNITTQKRIWNSLHTKGTNLETALVYLREVAEMFNSIDKHQRAGRRVFHLAGCHRDAAEAYAKGDQFSNCLTSCKKGKLFKKGMQYINHWKEHANNVQDNEIERITQELLESCAIHYHERNHPISMMRYVRAFRSMESKRVFLRSIGCLDELLLLEEESGHFLEAAEVVKSSWGDVLKEAELYEKAGQCLETIVLILRYMLFTSLWGHGNKGWPMKHFPQKEQLYKKAMSLSRKDSKTMYDHICRELKILYDEHISLSDLKKLLQGSKQHGSLRGEILSIRKILDAHLHWNRSSYGWEDELPLDIRKHSEGMIFLNRVSVRTLVFYWNMWKDHVVEILQSLGSLDSEEPDELDGHIEFCLDYFGVRSQRENDKMVYLLVCKDAGWIRKGGLHEDGKRLTFDRSWLVSSIFQSYWRSELVSVGIKVLKTLKALNKLMMSNGGSAFHQSTCLLHIFEVSKFLLECRYLNLTDNKKKKLGIFLEISTEFYYLVFPFDWRRSVCKDFMSLKETRLSLELLDEIISQNVNDIKGDYTTPWITIGKVMTILCLGYRKPIALYDEILTLLPPNHAWERFFKEFWKVGLIDHAASFHFWLALDYCYRVRESPSISPHSLLYLLDCLLFTTSLSSMGYFFTTKSSFLQWFTHLGSTCTTTPATLFSEEFTELVEDFVKYKKRKASWLNDSREDCLKLVMLLCLVCLKVRDSCKALRRLLVGKNNVASLLPEEFVSDLVRRKKGRDLKLNADVVAEAFMSVEDPLLIVSLENGRPTIHAPSAIFVDVRRCSKEEIMNVLFPAEKKDSNDVVEVLSEEENSGGNS